MSNKIKKLICSLLTAAMLVSSVGIAAIAAPDDATEAAGTEVTADVADASADAAADAAGDSADAAEATEAPAEATPAVTETPASVVVATSYDNDVYYQRALALCQSLGIISGFEDGSVKPDEKVTRAQMASIVLRMLAISGVSKYKNVFTDVTDAHWAADQIQSAYEAKVVSGMGNGTFAPDSEVTYVQVMVMLLNAMNYSEDAEFYGGWQQGYVKVAGDIGLLDNTTGSTDVAADRGVVIKMVYNALLADYKEVKTFDEYGQPKYSTDKTLAEAKFNVLEAKGLLIGTAKTTIGNVEIQEGQIEIKKDKETETTVYNTTLTDLDDCIARKITYYYRENSGRDVEVLAVTYDATKSETYTIDPENIDEITENGGVISIKENKVNREKKTTSDVKIVYNGKLATSDDYTDVLDLFDIENGSITLIKSDKNAVDNYDVVFIDSYETVVITSANNDKIVGKIQDPDGALGVLKSITITIDDKIDRTVTVTKAGEEIRARNLKKNDVATVKRSFDGSVVDIVVTGESVTGSVSSVVKGWNETEATINGDTYEVANVAAADLKTGAQGTFYTDMFGKIAYISSTVAGRLDAGEKYGWILTQYQAEGSGDKVLKILTQDGVVEAAYAANVDYWGPNAVEGGGKDGQQQTKAFMESEMEALLDGTATDGFPAKWVGTRVASGYVFEKPDGTYYIKGSAESPNDKKLDRPYSYAKSDAQVRLVKFKTNSSGKITKLYCAVYAGNIAAKQNYYSTGTDSEKYITEPYLTDSDIANLKANSKKPLIYDPGNKAGSVLVGGLLAGYTLTDDCIEFDVPNDPSKYDSETAYTVSNVKSSAYNVRENGVSDEFYFADYDGTTPAVLVKYVADPEAAVDVNMGTADSIPMMIVDKVVASVNKDDETVYKVVGYSSGAETSFTTTLQSALYKDLVQSDKAYGGTLEWDGKNGGADGESDSLAAYLHRGDIIVQSGGRILKLVDARSVHKGGAIPSGGLNFGSDTRVKYFWGPVTETGVDNVSWMKVNGQSLLIDDGAQMDVVEIDMSVSDSNKAITISDDYADIGDIRLQGADDNEVDCAYVRIAPKGALGEIIIFRFKNLGE